MTDLERIIASYPCGSGCACPKPCLVCDLTGYAERLTARLAAAEAVCWYFRDDTDLAAFGNYRAEGVFIEKVVAWREVAGR